MRRIVIVGAGAMGCLFAARLAGAEAEVTLVDVDARRLDALRRRGVTLSDDTGKRTVKVRVALAQEIAPPVDLVMVMTKALHTQAAVRSVAHLAASGAYALTLQNGLGNAEAIAEVFPPERIVFGVTDFPADLEGDTKVSSHGSGRAWIGGFRPEAQGAAEAIAQRFKAGGLDAVADPKVEVSIWAKLAFNAALNPVGAITGLTNGGLDSPEGRRIAFAVVDEVVAVADKKGVKLDRDAIRGRIEGALAHHRGHKASMLQDLLAGRLTEIDAINGAVARAGAEVGVRTPVNETLADLVRLVERGNRLPG